MEYKSKFIARYVYPQDRCTELVYQYRGEEYSVLVYHFETVETLRQQHEYNKRRIDDIVNHRERMKTAPTPKVTAQQAFDALYDYWETGEVNEEVFS